MMALELAANILVLATVIAAVAFVVLYSVLFDPSTTTAGRLIRRMMISLSTLGGLSILRAFFDEKPLWFDWLRLGVWAYVTFAFASMVWLILVRRFWPHRLRTRPHDGQPLEDTLEPRRRRRP
jgi:hypothetical protein